MKIFTKFKQLNREIKLVIITALIASCIGVYATGECIISATADDISYNNTTVQAAIDELFSMSSNYCPPGYECTKNLYGVMKNNSVLDDIASTYVSSSAGIDFSKISSNTNGKGIYEIASTKNNPYPIYYYRGAVDNNNVKFAGFCWKAVRTTDTGGVKLIYNGEPDQDGYCTNTTGTETKIGSIEFNDGYTSPVYVGYMYGTYYNSSTKSASTLNNAYVYGNDVTYSNGTYTLNNTMTTTGTWSTDYSTLNNNHYTCFTTGTTCTNVYYIYYTKSSEGASYITLKNGKKIEDALDDMFNGSNVNNTNSKVKTQIDNWYSNNLLSYTDYIEDTVYCNDRSISELNGWDPNGGDTGKYLSFSPYTRTWTNHTPSLVCNRVVDRFTVSSSIGNGALTYPVGLLTSDEAMYAGGKGSTNNNNYYLYNDQMYWSISPRYFNTQTMVVGIHSTGLINFFNVGLTHGIRPVISLKTSEVESGNGTPTNPYVIKTN
jgi:hypothetical protein